MIELSEKFWQNQVIKLLKTILDPEVGINIWDFGLIYGVLVKNLGNSQNQKFTDSQNLESQNLTDKNVQNSGNSENLQKNLEIEKKLEKVKTWENQKTKNSFWQMENKLEEIENSQNSQNLNYSQRSQNNFDCYILMTFTSINCPAIESLPNEIKQKIEKLGVFAKIEIEIVWEPKWEIGLLSEEIQFELGLL